MSFSVEQNVPVTLRIQVTLSFHQGYPASPCDEVEIVTLPLSYLATVQDWLCPDSPDTQKMHYVDDWTHHHMVFSDPGHGMTRRGAELEKWKRITADPPVPAAAGQATHRPRPVMADPNEEWRRDDPADIMTMETAAATAGKGASR